ncbi:MAG TPA: EF-hand domain-containing protein [Verrucomicrobiae bacterium]|jgi:hypothetical protein
MKRISLAATVALLASTLVFAQDKPADGKGRRGGGNPIIAALDANHDGEIDANEIANAPAALRKLDKNGDGKLTRDELRPARANGEGGKKGKNKNK